MGGTDVLERIAIGTSLVIGTVSETGEPRATRAWSAEVLDREPLRIRVLMGADDEAAVANLGSGSVAVTGADVRTLESLQVKGQVVVVEPATTEDLARVAEHTDRFFEAVHETDGTPVSLLRRLCPHEVIAFEMVVDGTFDQSPGPAAGAVMNP